MSELGEQRTIAYITKGLAIVGVASLLFCGGKTASLRGTEADLDSGGARGAMGGSAATDARGGTPGNISDTASDAGGPGPDDSTESQGDSPFATCPLAEPMSGSACDGPLDCAYPGPCGSVVAKCGAVTSYWAVTETTPCGGACPALEPPRGAPCPAPGKCTYTSSCGAKDIVVCGGTGTVTEVTVGDCPVCPTDEPGPSTMCFGSLACAFRNLCGGTDTAQCDGVAGTWTVLRGDCEN